MGGATEHESNPPAVWNEDSREFVCHPYQITEDWCDYNGHMNVAYYVRIFDMSLDQVFVNLGFSGDYVKREQKSHFTLEAHIDYSREVLATEQVFVRYRITDVSPKITAFHATMHGLDNPEVVRAVWEQLTISVDMQSRRACAMPGDILERITSYLSQPTADVRSGRVAIKR